MKAKHKFILSESDYDTQLEMLRPEMASSSLTYARYIHISCSGTRNVYLRIPFRVLVLGSQVLGSNCFQNFGFLLRLFIIPQTWVCFDPQHVIR